MPHARVKRNGRLESNCLWTQAPPSGLAQLVRQLKGGGAVYLGRLSKGSMLDHFDIPGSHPQLLSGLGHGIPPQHSELEHTPIARRESGEDTCDPVLGLAALDSKRLGPGDKVDMEVVDWQHGAVTIVGPPMVCQHRPGGLGRAGEPL